MHIHAYFSDFNPADTHSGEKKEQTTNGVGVLKYFQWEIQLWVCLNVFKLLEVAGRYLNKDISSKAFIS